MKGLNEFLEALEGFDYSEKEKPDYCLYYDDAGKIYEASPEEREELARSFGSYLEGLRDKLLAHKLEFIEDSGLVEVVGGQSPTRSGQSGRK